jgi:hypothetical protein
MCTMLLDLFMIGHQMIQEDRANKVPLREQARPSVSIDE